jgi:hypothetical protein
MSRLIDADDLIEYIKIWDIGNSISSDQKEFINCVNEQPTVFNVDKVVKQLEKRSALARPVGWSKAYEIIILKDAIEIVKEGGVE